MRRAAALFLDWFIPNVATSERSEIGVARTFVFTSFLGPLVLQAIAIWLHGSDPAPGLASWAIIVLIAACWTLPFVFKATGRFRLVALISVELLWVASLLGTSIYGGVSSPFLPWLVLSLMLGFFYLPDRAVLLLGMFSVNIAGMVLVHSTFSFRQHIAVENLGAISWFSIASATAYMSWMAIYYANIISMSSNLEREIESHRAIAQRLRDEKDLADTASRGKSVFLAKMSEQLRTPLSTIIADSGHLLETLSPSDGDRRRAELEKIDAAGRRLMALVVDALDVPATGADALRRG